MKKITFLALLAALWLSPVNCMAMEVTEAVITTGLEDRHPVDTGEIFPASVGRLYCFTEITGASAEGTVTHVWSWEGREMARVELPVRSVQWRTWSSKTLLPEWIGNWKVEVLDENGARLRVIPFTLR